MRYAQGHSFSNLGYAYGQLGELEKSQEQFTHALQAAKDCQDFRGQWQAYEGLSAIHYQKKDFEKAVECLKIALTVLPLGGVINDDDVQERIVAKLSNALEKQLTEKQTTKQSNEKLKVDGKKGLRKEHRGVNRDVSILKDSAIAVNGSLHDNDETLQDNDPKESTPKVGHIRPREKNHKFIARGLHIDEPTSDIEQSDASDSTFDTISSYSGHASKSTPEAVSETGSVCATSNLESTAGSAALAPPKKDPLNNTYEEPQDIINVIDTGRLRLHELPPGPRDTVLASMSNNAGDQEMTTVGKRRKNKNKSTVCVIQ